MRTSAILMRFLIAGLLICCLAPARAEQKRDVKFYQKQFDHWSKVIADLKGADVTEGAMADTEVIRTWIGQAQAFLASDKLKQIDPLLQRIEAQAEYVRTKIKRIAAEDAAAEGEELARTAQQEAEKARQAADGAEKKLKDLEAQGF